MLRVGLLLRSGSLIGDGLREGLPEPRVLRAGIAEGARHLLDVGVGGELLGLLGAGRL